MSNSIVYRQRTANNKFSKALGPIKRIAITMSLSGIVAAGFAVPAHAANTNNHGNGMLPGGIGTYTTLDACGFYSGNQTPTVSHDVWTNGGNVDHHNEKGTWSGIYTGYSGNGTPVPGLSNVTGTYNDNYTYTLSTGAFNGTEELHSKWGNISQQYSYKNNTWSVNVNATGQLKFLTSNTNGKCD